MPTPDIERLVEEALDALSAEVSLEEQVVSSHHVLVATGIETPSAQRSLGTYLAASVAGVIQSDATINASLIGDHPSEADAMRAAIDTLIGAGNVFTTAAERAFRDTRRNAWIGEGVGHALLILRARRDTALLAGEVAALKGPHPSPTRQGLDLVALYVVSDELAFVVGEGKASAMNGSAELTNAAGMFARIDQGKHELEIRQDVTALKPALEPTLRSKVASAVWQDRRCYLPLIVYESAFDLTTARPALAALAPPVDRRRVVACRVAAFHPFFDGVADGIRAAIGEFWP